MILALLIVVAVIALFVMLNVAVAVSRIADALEAQNRHFGIQKTGEPAGAEPDQAEAP